MSQMNADLRESDTQRDFRNHLKRTVWSFALIFLVGIGLGFLLFRSQKLNLQALEFRVWIFLAATGIPYWFIAFRSRVLHFKAGWRIIGSVVFSIGSAFFTLGTFYLILVIFVLISVRGTYNHRGSFRLS